MLIETTASHKNDIKTHKLCSNGIFSTRRLILIHIDAQWSYLFLINIKFNETMSWKLIFTMQKRRRGKLVSSYSSPFTLSHYKSWLRRNNVKLYLTTSSDGCKTISCSLLREKCKQIFLQSCSTSPLWKSFEYIQRSLTQYCEKLLIFFLQRYATFFIYFFSIASTSISIRLQS